MSDWISWLEDLTQEDSGSVGRKCANLGELTRAGFRVPPGFALSLGAYEGFLRATGADGEIREYFALFDADPNDPKQLAKFTEASAAAREIVESKAMPRDIADPLARYYDELCARTGVQDVPVATRSAGPASHPGQYESFLNVTGHAGVVENVIKVWSSTFNTRSLVARARKGLPLESDPIGVAVLKMVDADAAGVMFTAEPTTADATRIIIEGSPGLGEIVVSGAVIPDNWTVDTAEFAVVECRAAPTGQRACLFDEEVTEIARIGKRIEAHFGKPQDIEWAIDRSLPSNPIFILQARPETFRINFRF
ncbi:MAG: PEP/pyruvate-binding domain-containing protein [bacterium]